MTKKSYKIKQKRSIESILNGLDIQFYSMRVEAPSRESVEWVVGLTDNEDDPEVHYIRCKSNEDAVAVVNELVVNKNCVRGIDIGKNPTNVYFSCEDT